MPDHDPATYEKVSARPVKSFFVEMLTRDIKLEEAILDLLDNCVDGILRTKKPNKKTPYAGFWADIRFDNNSFTISDNCGGIPWALHDYAFRMGRPADRPPDKPGTVGIYGIGMKRAIFKMGRNCLISTQSGRHSYIVTIKSKWLSDESDWALPVKAAKKLRAEDGTTISISDLYLGIAASFGEQTKSFSAGLAKMVETHYAFIIDKGFKVTINGIPVAPHPVRIIFSEHPKGIKTHAIRPFIYKVKTTEGVEVFLTVGLTRPIPSQDEIAEEQEGRKYSARDAGWTVVCNDRAVLYCDHSEMTGWGEAGVPRYHPQFNAISGIVEFRCSDASKLPTTTTKRGIDATSSLYLQVKNKMREGMRLFTDYTNKWKALPEESKKQMEAGRLLSFGEIKAKEVPFSITRDSGKQFRPELPMPRRLEPGTRRISFARSTEEIEIVSEYLFGDSDTDPSVAGEECFARILREARR